MYNNCELIDLPSCFGKDGNLTYIEKLPFKIRRVYYLHSIPNNIKRGVHAHKALEQLIIAISGSFDITIDDGQKRSVIHMNNPAKALYVCPMIWREINNFSKNSVLMVLASTEYDEYDYIHNYDEFIALKQKR